MIINTKISEAMNYQISKINSSLRDAGESYFITLKPDIEDDQLYLQDDEILISYRISTSSSSTATVDNTTEFFDSAVQLTCYFMLDKQAEDYHKRSLKLECIFSGLNHSLQENIEELTLIEDYSKNDLPQVYCELAQAQRVRVNFNFRSCTIVNQTTIDNNVFVFMIENRYKSILKTETK